MATDSISLSAVHPDARRLALYDPQTGRPTLNNPARHDAPPSAVMSIGLVGEIFAALERHGHKLPDGEERHAAIGCSIGVLVTLVDAYTEVRS